MKLWLEFKEFKDSHSEKYNFNRVQTFLTSSCSFSMGGMARIFDLVNFCTWGSVKSLTQTKLKSFLLALI